MLQNGMQAPAFSLPDQNGKTVSLSDFFGKRSCFTSIQKTTRRDVRARHARLPRSSTHSGKKMPL